MNGNPYIRQRRRSNLGKRYRASREPVHAEPLNTTVNGLDRLWTAKKTNLTLKVTRECNETKKRLMFCRTSDTNSDDLNFSSVQKVGNSSSSPPYPSSSFDYLDNSLNMTGIHCFKTPTPEHNVSVKKPSAKISVFDDLELPKSPGPSLYDQLIMKELVALKPPVDPEDSKLRIENLLLEDKPKSPSKCAVESYSTVNKPTSNNIKEPKNFSPRLSSAYIGSFPADKERESNSETAGAVDKFKVELNTISEDLDTSDSFLLEEQNMIDLNQTIVALESISLDKDVKFNLIDSKNVESNFDKNVSESDEDLEILEGIDQEIQDINKRIVSLQLSVQRLIKNRRERRNKIRNEDKENIPNKKISIEKVPEASTKKSQKNWISNLKMDNPRLLKTPKRVNGNKTNMSFAEQSAIWTPHSMSTILYEQIEDLFDDK